MVTLSSLHGEAVRFDNERFAVVLGHDVENDTRREQQQSGDNEHDRANEGGEPRHHTGVPEVHRHHAAQYDADDAEDAADSAEERQRLVLTNHAEDGRHHLDAIADGVKLADGPFRTITILDRHLVQTQVVVQ